MFERNAPNICGNESFNENGRDLNNEPNGTEGELIIDGSFTDLNIKATHYCVFKFSFSAVNRKTCFH